METLTWQQVNRRFQGDYPQILDLFDLILTIPATSTACERGFSHMKMIKTDRCTRMKEEALSNCLTIKLEGPSIQDFDPLPAIEFWFNKARHRPGTSRSKENKLDATAAAMVLENVEERGDDEKVDEEPAHGVNAHPPGYELVEHPDDDSDYGSEYDSTNEDDHGVFNRLTSF